MAKYQPTGRPPGRPSNAAKAAEESLAARNVTTLLKDTTVDRATRPMSAICPECFPAGWLGICVMGSGIPASANCQHGTWVRRL